MAAVAPQTGRWRGYWGLFLIVAGALILRAVFASLPRVIRWDEPDYLWLGKSLLTGRGYTINGVPELHYTPLFPILAGAIYVLTGNPELGSAFWYVLLGALVVVPVYFVAQRFYGRRVATLSAVLVAFFPGLSSAILYWGTMTEPLFIFLVCCALWLAVIALEEDKLWAYAALGGVLALAYLARPEGIVWWGVWSALVLGVRLAQRRLFRWATLARLGIYLAVFILVAAPYAVYMHDHTGKWLVTGKLSITYDIGEAVLRRDPVLYDQVTASLDSESGEILWWSNKRFERGLWDILREDPAAFLARMGRNVQQMRAAVFSSLIFPPFLLAPVVLAWFRQPWNRRRLLHEALLVGAGLPVLAFLPFHVEVRFFSPIFPILLIWLAAGLWDLGAWFGETLAHWRPGQDPAQEARWRGGLVAALALLLALYWGVVHGRTITAGMQDLSYAHKMVGLWLKEHTPPDAVIMSRDLAVSLYAERGFVASPRADYATYLAYARRKGATHLLVDERELRVLRPHLAFLLDETNPPPELEPVITMVDGRGRTIVYRLKG